jgi:hypothetical protein
MEGHEMILVIGAKGHVTNNWDFHDSQIRKVKGSVEGTSDMRGCDMMRDVGLKNVVQCRYGERISCLIGEWS